LPIFQNEGVFDAELYRRELQSRGMSVDQFEQSLRHDTALDQYRTGIVDTAFILPAEQQRLDQLTNQVRKTDYLRFSIDERKAETEVSDDEIQTWFDENADDYQFPQRVKIQYVELNRASISLTKTLKPILTKIADVTLWRRSAWPHTFYWKSMATLKKKLLR